MSASQDNHLRATIDSLFVEALRQGQRQWFRVSSGSMMPLLRIGDAIAIEPAPAREIRVGEIAAFETEDGLVIHRIIDIQISDGNVRLLQMPDVNLRASWISGSAVAGRVATIQRKSRQLNLNHPIARWYGKVTAHIRSRLYRKKANFSAKALRVCSRLLLLAGCWCIERCCRTVAVPTHPIWDER